MNGTMKTTRSENVLVYNFNLNFFNNFGYKKKFWIKIYRISLKGF